MSVRWTNRFWLVSLELTLFLDFLKLLLKMHLAASFAGKKSYFLDLWIKRYGCLKFLVEVWARQACAGANEEELTKHQKFWGQEGGGKEARGWKNGGPVGARLAAGRPQWGDRRLGIIFWFFVTTIFAISPTLTKFCNSYLVLGNLLKP
jgi:hypothetical protein